MQVQCTGMHVHINFQVPTCYIFGNIVKNVLFSKYRGTFRGSELLPDENTDGHEI